MTLQGGSLEPNYHHAVAGAVSGGLTRFLCQPLDVVKIRFQLQVEPIRKSTISKYHSMLQTVRLVTKEEGLLALWKGHVPAQLLSITFGTSQFYTYHMSSNYLEHIPGLSEWTATLHFVAGAISGSTSTIISFPFDTVRTRLVAQSSQNPIYKGNFDALTSIIKYESVRGLFRGLLPTLLQIAPHAGLQFGLYEFFKEMNIFPGEAEDPNHHVGVSHSLVAGCGAGLVAKTVVYPFDLARRRLQIQGFRHGRQGFGDFFACKGMMDCVAMTMKKEGKMGLFKGLGPSQFKAALTTALYFTFFEQALNMLQTQT